MLFKITEKDGLWKKIRNHVGTKVEHPVSQTTRDIRSRISDEGVKKSVSVCPYCAVGCSTLVYHREGRIIDIEGNPESPINAGTLCPKGSATFGMHVSPHRKTKVRGKIHCKALVSDRIPVYDFEGKKVHIIGLPYHWGPNGVAKGDVLNDLMPPIALEANVAIHEAKAFTANLEVGKV